MTHRNVEDKLLEVLDELWWALDLGYEAFMIRYMLPRGLYYDTYGVTNVSTRGPNPSGERGPYQVHIRQSMGFPGKPWATFIRLSTRRELDVVLTTPPRFKRRLGDLFTPDDEALRREAEAFVALNQAVMLEFWQNNYMCSSELIERIVYLRPDGRRPDGRRPDGRRPD